MFWMSQALNKSNRTRWKQLVRVCSQTRMWALDTLMQCATDYWFAASASRPTGSVCIFNSLCVCPIMMNGRVFSP